MFDVILKAPSFVNTVTTAADIALHTEITMLTKVPNLHHHPSSPDGRRRMTCPFFVWIALIAGVLWM